MMQDDDAVTNNAIPDGRLSIQVTGAGHRPHAIFWNTMRGGFEFTRENVWAY